MPCDYSKYPKNWKNEIRPEILKRAGDRCEKCGVANYAIILRGEWCGRAVYQDMDGWIFSAENSEKIGGGHLGEVDITGNRKFTKIVLTIAHLDHDTANNDLQNLKALCQKCHLNYDSGLHRTNARATFERVKGLISLFSD
jgi:hypothetical protein